MSDVAELARALNPPSPFPGLALRQATVVAVEETTGTLSVRVGASSVAISVKRLMTPETPAVGDAVWVLQNGPDLLALGRVARPGGQAETYPTFGSIEVRHPTGNAYIDFSRTPGTGDHDIRIINRAADELAVEGGKLVVDSGIATNFRSTGAGAGFEFRDRGDWLNDNHAWALYANAAVARLWKAGYGDVFIFDPGGRMEPGVAQVGTHQVHTSYAHFGHRNNDSASNYCFLTNGDESIVSAPGNVYLSRNGQWVCRLDASGFTVNDDIAIPSDRALYFKGPWDGTHLIHHWGAMDGFVYRTWAEHRFECTGARRATINDSGIYCHSGWFRNDTGTDQGIYNHYRGQGIQFTADGVRTYPNGVRLDAYLFDHLGHWPTVPLFVRSDGGGSGARVTFRAAGQNAAPMWKAWGQAFEARSWDDVSMIPIRGVIENFCRESSKEAIRSLEERLPRTQRKQKLKALRSVHYQKKERGQGCANCLGTGQATKNERIKSALDMKRAHERGEPPEGREAFDPDRKTPRAAPPARALPREIADVVEPVEGEPCPDCGGLGVAWERPENRKAEEPGWLGFVAEEIEQAFPEAMFYRQDEDGEVRVSGVDHMALIAILWEEVKALGGFEDEQRGKADDLARRVDAIERLPVVALNKPKGAPAP